MTESEYKFRAWRTTENVTDVGKFVVTFVVSQAVFDLILARFTYERGGGGNRTRDTNLLPLKKSPSKLCDTS